METAVASLAAASALAIRAASIGLVMIRSLSHAGLLAKESGVVPGAWNLVKLGSWPTALRSAGIVVGALPVPRILARVTRNWLSSCWARASTSLSSAAFGALSIAAGKLMLVNALPWVPPALLSQRYLGPSRSGRSERTSGFAHAQCDRKPRGPTPTFGSAVEPTCGAIAVRGRRFHRWNGTDLRLPGPLVLRVLVDQP